MKSEDGIYNDEYFINRGYKVYKRICFQSTSVVKNFQKCFSDDVGKKYFIDIHKWSNDYIPLSRRDSYWSQFSYEYSVQVYSKNKHQALDLGFHSDWTIEEVEIFIEQLFQSGKLDYYERWQDDHGF